MSYPRALRTVQDVRTVQVVRGARSAPGRLGAANEQRAYALLTELAREKQRLEGQRQFWQRKFRRIDNRLVEIAALTERLLQQVPARASDRQAPPPSADGGDRAPFGTDCARNEVG